MKNDYKKVEGIVCTDALEEEILHVENPGQLYELNKVFKMHKIVCGIVCALSFTAFTIGEIVQHKVTDKATFDLVKWGISLPGALGACLSAVVGSLQSRYQTKTVQKLKLISKE